MATKQRQFQFKEPTCFHRRLLQREVRQLWIMTIRATAFGLVVAAILHAIMMAFSVPLPMPAYPYYATVTLVVNMLRVLFSLTFLSAVWPRLITIKPRTLVIGSRQFSNLRIHDWTFRALPAQPGLAVLRIRFHSHRQRLRKVTIGLGQEVDLLRLDRALDVMRRMAAKKVADA